MQAIILGDIKGSMIRVVTLPVTEGMEGVVGSSIGQIGGSSLPMTPKG